MVFVLFEHGRVVEAVIVSEQGGAFNYRVRRT